MSEKVPPEFKFCPYCATPLERKLIEGRERAYCPNCGYVHYRNPLPSVGIIAYDDERRFVLIKRGREPQKGMWAPPSGFIEEGEDPEDTVLRELEEETGLRGEVEELLGVYRNNTGVYGDVLVITYLTRIVGGSLKPGDDADEAGFFRYDELPDIPFRCFRESLKKAIEILEDKDG